MTIRSSFEEGESGRNPFDAAIPGPQRAVAGWYGYHPQTLAALGALYTGRPVKLVLRRGEDMEMTGKRHPYQADFRLGLDGDGRLLAYQVDLYQNAGAYTDLSLAVLERTLFHVGGSYHISNLRTTGWSCRTNLRPFTVMCGFGGPQACFVLEAAIRRAARQTGLPPERIQVLSLLSDGDPFPYGMPAVRCRARACWRMAHEYFAVDRGVRRVTR